MLCTLSTGEKVRKTAARAFQRAGPGAGGERGPRLGEAWGRAGLPRPDAQGDRPKQAAARAPAPGNGQEEPPGVRRTGLFCSPVASAGPRKSARAGLQKARAPVEGHTGHFAPWTLVGIRPCLLFLGEAGSREAVCDLGPGRNQGLNGYLHSPAPGPPVGRAHHRPCPQLPPLRDGENQLLPLQGSPIG